MGDEQQDKPKDVWDKLKIVSGLAGVTLIPVAVIFSGYWVNTTIKDREVRANADAMAREIQASADAMERQIRASTLANDRTFAVRNFELALVQLQIPANEHPMPAMREWAIGVFEKHTGVPVEVTEQIKSDAIPRVLDQSPAERLPALEWRLCRLQCNIDNETETERKTCIDKKCGEMPESLK